MVRRKLSPIPIETIDEQGLGLVGSSATEQIVSDV